jgi:hypothetical protein
MAGKVDEARLEGRADQGVDRFAAGHAAFLIGINGAVRDRKKPFCGGLTPVHHWMV